MQQKNKFNTAYQEILQESPTLGGGSFSNLRNAENGGGMNVGGMGGEKQKHVSLLDILSQVEQQRRKQRPDSPIITYPLQNKLPDDVSELVRQVADITGLFVQAKESPVFKANDKGTKACEQAIKKLKKVGAILMSLRDNFDDLVVDY